MLRFNASNVPATSPFSIKNFTLLGDGKSAEVEIDLSKAPLGMEFIGEKYPDFVFVQSFSDLEDAPEVRISGSRLTIALMPFRRCAGRRFSDRGVFRQLQYGDFSDHSFFASELDRLRFEGRKVRDAIRHGLVCVVNWHCVPRHYDRSTCPQHADHVHHRKFDGGNRHAAVGPEHPRGLSRLT
jgi:hypothetical protein